VRAWGWDSPGRLDSSLWRYIFTVRLFWTIL